MLRVERVDPMVQTVAKRPGANRVRLEHNELGEAGQGSKEEWKAGVLADTSITFPR